MMVNGVWQPDPLPGAAPAPSTVTTAPMAPFQVVAPPEESNRTETVGPSTTTVKPTEEATQALGDMKTAQATQEAALDTEGAAKQDKLKAEADQAEKAAAAAEQSARDREAVKAQNAAEVQRLQLVADQRRKEMEANAHPTSYWEDRGRPATILAKFLTVLGGATGGAAGTGNEVYAAYKAEEAQDRQEKIRKYTESKEFHALARQDVTAARAALADQLKQFDDQASVQANVLAKQLDAVSKRMGIPQAAAESAGFKAKVQADNAERRAKEQEHYSTQVQSGHTTVSHTENVNKGPAGGAPDLTVLDLKGKVVGMGRSDVEAKRLRESQASAVGVSDALDKLKSHVLSKGREGNVPGSNEKAERESLISDATSYLTTMYNTGVLNAGEYDRYKSQLNTSLIGRGGEATAAGLDTMKAGIESRYNAHVKAETVPVTAPATPAAAPGPEKAAPAPTKRKAIETKEVGGKRYVRRGEDWFAL